MQWNIPTLGSDEYKIYYTDHSVIDFNGDGKPDLVDSGDGGNVFMNGSQRYWKVYLNTGSGFSATPLQWNVPGLGNDEYKVYDSDHGVYDFNGDDKPDLVDSSDNGNIFMVGGQRFWKVYLNTGSGFSPTYIQWNVPALGYDDYMIASTVHNVIDFDGDNRPDLVDSSDDGNVFVNGAQQYWKVYVNTGTGFSQTPIQWNIPNIQSYEYLISYGSHGVIDFNGDNKPDLIDSGDNGDVFVAGSQKFWKVYLNTGSGFSPTPLQWNIPDLNSYEYMVSYTSHSEIDFNGDNKPDLIDSGDNGDVFLNGSQKYWKVYLNTGVGFSPTPVQWNIPGLNSDEYMVASTSHNVIDFNADNKPDLIDSGDNGNVFVNGAQKYWKVYLNTASGLSTTTFDDEHAIKMYPNPVRDVLHFQFGSDMSDISIYNVQGLRVATAQISGSQTTIDLAHLPTGLYFAKVSGRVDGVYILRFVKE